MLFTDGYSVIRDENFPSWINRILVVYIRAEGRVLFLFLFLATGQIDSYSCPRSQRLSPLVPAILTLSCTVLLHCCRVVVTCRKPGNTRAKPIDVTTGELLHAPYSTRCRCCNFQGTPSTFVDSSPWLSAHSRMMKVSTLLNSSFPSRPVLYLIYINNPVVLVILAMSAPSPQSHLVWSWILPTASCLAKTTAPQAVPSRASLKPILEA